MADTPLVRPTDPSKSYWSSIHHQELAPTDLPGEVTIGKSSLVLGLVRTISCSETCVSLIYPLLSLQVLNEFQLQLVQLFRLRSAVQRMGCCVARYRGLGALPFAAVRFFRFGSNLDGKPFAPQNRPPAHKPATDFAHNWYVRAFHSVVRVQRISHISHSCFRRRRTGGLEEAEGAETWIRRIGNTRTG